MGLFSRNTQPAPVDLGHMRELFFRTHPQFDALPPVADQLDAVAAAGGVDRRDLDELEATTRLFNLFRGLVEHASSSTGNRSLTQRVDGVFASPAGVTDQALWDALFSCGTSGVAAAGFVAETFADGSAAVAVASSMRDSGLLDASYTELPDPGLDQGNPKQVVHSLLAASGFTTLIHGPDSPNALFDAVAGAAPSLAQSDASGWLGKSPEGIIWTILTDNRESVFAAFYGGDLSDGASLAEVAQRLADIGGPWKASVAKVGALVPTDVARLLQEAGVVEAFTLDAFADPSTREGRRRIRRALEQGGFERVGSVLYKGVLPGSGERTQLIWVGFDRTLTLLSPFAEIEGEELPPHLAVEDGRYTAQAFPPFAVLQLELPYTIDEDDLRREALEIARQADSIEHALNPASDDL